MDTNCDEMPAGRELDALVAEQVMGLTSCDGRSGEGGYCQRCGHYKRQWFYGDPPHKYLAPDYSTDIAAAWQVVERMLRLHRCPSVECKNPECDQWRVFVTEFKRNGGVHHLTASETALRISRAALKAVAHG